MCIIFDDGLAVGCECVLLCCNGLCCKSDYSNTAIVTKIHMKIEMDTNLLGLWYRLPLIWLWRWLLIRCTYLQWKPQNLIIVHLVWFLSSMDHEMTVQNNLLGKITCKTFVMICLICRKYGMMNVYVIHTGHALKWYVISQPRIQII